MAIGHVRYSTTGGGSWENAQPVWRDDGRELALAHNGNLTNAVELYNELTRARASSFRGTSDSEIIAALLSVQRGSEPIEDAVATVMPRLEGAYSTVVMTKRRGRRLPRPARGPAARRSGQLGDRFCVASESCAFDIIGAKLLREVQPGEMVSLDRARARDAPGRRGRAPGALRLRAHLLLPARQPPRGPRPAGGRAGGWARSSAREAPVDADLVISVPDSGNPAANGFARAAGPAARTTA